MFFLFLVALTISSYVSSAHINSVGTNILGGDAVTIDNFKYQVALLQNHKLWCGGSIISEKHVLTAAQCILKATGTLTVRSGSSFWYKYGSLHNVTSTNAYSKFLWEDIGILTVGEPFVFDLVCQPIPIGTYDIDEANGALALASGWGSVESGNFPHQLRAVEVPIVDKLQCYADYGGPKLKTIKNTQICAGIDKKAGCEGDYGGPLVLDGVLIGVSSNATGCGLPNYPGIYADVAYFSDWIKEQIAKDE